jgi:hypothetical protein
MHKRYLIFNIKYPRINDPKEQLWVQATIMIILFLYIRQKTNTLHIFAIWLRSFRLAVVLSLGFMRNSKTCIGIHKQIFLKIVYLNTLYIFPAIPLKTKAISSYNKLLEIPNFIIIK